MFCPEEETLQPDNLELTKSFLNHETKFLIFKTTHEIDRHCSALLAKSPKIIMWTINESYQKP